MGGLTRLALNRLERASSVKTAARKHDGSGRGDARKRPEHHSKAVVEWHGNAYSVHRSQILGCGDEVPVVDDVVMAATEIIAPVHAGRKAFVSNERTLRTGTSSGVVAVPMPRSQAPCTPSIADVAGRASVGQAG